MSIIDVVVLFVAGILAGTINAVVGSGSLITFPALLALGFPPVLANVTSNVGVLPGSIASTVAYRRQLAGRWKHLGVIALFSGLGGIAGALLLLQLPAAAFRMIVPALIVIALLLVVFGPALKRWSEARANGAARPEKTALLFTAAGLTGVYGGYFGAAQGVLLLSFLPLLIKGGLQQANAYKNVLAGVANFTAAIVFVSISEVAWWAALSIATGAFLGGALGGKYGQKLPQNVYRVFIVVVGVAALTYFYLTG